MSVFVCLLVFAKQILKQKNYLEITKRRVCGVRSKDRPSQMPRNRKLSERQIQREFNHFGKRYNTKPSSIKLQFSVMPKQNQVLKHVNKQDNLMQRETKKSVLLSYFCSLVLFGFAHFINIMKINILPSLSLFLSLA